MADSQVDIRENDIFRRAPEVLEALLRDCTLSWEGVQANISWATDCYAERGEGYRYDDRITAAAITGKNGGVIVPRAVKPREEQQQRSRDRAEVFTPAWMCNKQNNLIDNAWFGREGVFNTEVDNPDGTHTWTVNTEPVTFPEGRSWRDYVNEKRLEITCGEAPYLVSRYDAVTGKPIPTERRIGLLDRKLRVVGENTDSSRAWLRAARAAYMSVYGFEWQGDNLVLARENLLYTFIDYYRAKFGKAPQRRTLRDIAYIISWNIWQMDGLKGTLPGADTDATEGVYALIKDWSARKPRQIVRFIDLVK